MENKENKAVEKAQKIAKKQERKQEIEKQNAIKRVEKARAKAHKKEEKQRLKALKKRQRKARWQELKEQEKQNKIEIKKRKEEEKRQRKNIRKSNRQRKKENKKGYAGWLAAVISLGVATLILASALSFTLLMPSENDNSLEATYQKSFYDTVEQVDNIDLNLSKILATKDTVAMQQYLVDTAINSELAENDIQQLPLQDENKFYTTKLINQIGDFSKYLNKKLASGQSLSESDRAGLVQLYQANARFKQSLERVQKQMNGNFNFSSMGNAKDGNLVIDNFNELQNLSVQYPELIYDGPFSDGLDRKEIKGLQGKEITQAEARQIFTEIFSDYKLNDVKNVGESTGLIKCYNVQATVDGENLYAQISKTGGKLLMFAYAGDCTSVEFSEQTAIQTAKEFLSSLGIKDMTDVWSNLTNNVYTINFAYSQDGVIVYPDLIKVRVCAKTCNVIGLESSGYYINHAKRDIASPTLSKSQAQKYVSDFIQVENGRLALIPIGNSSEKLCYEFNGEYDGAEYYVYIDAVTGNQLQMFKVVTNNDGLMLM